MQSVLVTVDGHEWYAPPQIYTRDACSGLWTAKPALPSDSPLSGMNHFQQILPNHHISSSTDEPSLVKNLQQDIIQNSAHSNNGVTSLEIGKENVADESDGGTKKRRVKEDLSADGMVIADYQGPAAAADNASLADRVIEPTLVMFEVLCQGFF